jgi:predicted nucleic acid-binding protein
MKILMDADCLIKITKCGLKKLICQNFKIFIPAKVKEEVVDQGLQKGYKDAQIVSDNIEKGLIAVKKHKGAFIHGEQELLALYQNGTYDAVATDDAKFIRIAMMANIHYILPAVFIVIMNNNRIFSLASALQKLQELAPFISEDEYMAAKIHLETKS